MAKVIGIFEREQQVLDAARRLRAAGIGAEAGALSAVVRSEETAPLLSAQSELPVEGVAGWREMAEREEREDGGLATEGWIVPSTAALLSLQGTGMQGMQGSGMPGQAAPIAAFGLAGLGDDEYAPARFLGALGLSAAAASGATAALNAGRYALIVDGAAGADGGAAALMREEGALDVLT